MNDTFVKGKNYCDLLAFFHAKKESDYFPGLDLKKTGVACAGVRQSHGSEREGVALYL